MAGALNVAFVNFAPVSNESTFDVVYVVFEPYVPPGNLTTGGVRSPNVPTLCA